MNKEIPDYTKELKDYANKLWDEPTIYDPGEVINKLLTMIGKIPDPASARYHQSPVAERDERPYTKEEVEKLIERISSFHKAVSRYKNEIKYLKDKIAQYETPSREAKDDAVAFAEWIKKEGYNQRSAVDWAIYRTHLSDVEIYTTQQLYNLFSESIKQKQ